MFLSESKVIKVGLSRTEDQNWGGSPRIASKLIDLGQWLNLSSTWFLYLYNGHDGRICLLWCHERC